jgi:hypothetical protein
MLRISLLTKSEHAEIAPTLNQAPRRLIGESMRELRKRRIRFYFKEEKKSV